jgi:lactate dehydrogenase-like 2-hydroxyacid dehydrogenase
MKQAECVTRPRLLITRRWPRQAIEVAQRAFDVVVNEADVPLERHELTAALCNYDAICATITDRFDASILSAPRPRTRILANFGAGTDHVDLAAAAAAGIVVTNTPDILTQATAELTILLMMMLARRAGEGERQLRAGEWPGWHPVHLMGRDLSGLHLGLVGFGRIGQATARIARSLWNMRISYHSRRSGALPADLSEVKHQPDLDALLGDADIVSLQCPGGAATHHLIDARALSRMKPTAFLINTARGTVVDETALADALRSGTIAGAGLDVYEDEPAVVSALLGLENVVLLPHLGSATVETRTSMGLRALENLHAFFAGNEPRDRVF